MMIGYYLNNKYKNKRVRDYLYPMHEVIFAFNDVALQKFNPFSKVSAEIVAIFAVLKDTCVFKYARMRARNIA